MGRFVFTVSRPVGIVTIAGTKAGTVPTTDDKILHSILIVKTTKTLSGIIPRQWLREASLRYAADNLNARYQSGDDYQTSSAAMDCKEIHPPVNYIGVIFKPVVYLQVRDMRDKSIVKATNTKMIESIIETLTYSFQRTIQRYAKGERTYMEKDNIDIYYHLSGRTTLISNATPQHSNVIMLAFYNIEVMAEILKVVDSSLSDKGHDLKINKGSDTVRISFFYDRKLTRSVWKPMAITNAATAAVPGGITKRLEKVKNGNTTFPVPVTEFSLYEVDYDAVASLYTNPLVFPASKKELSIIEIALSSIHLDPHSYSSCELSADDAAQADINLKTTKFVVPVSVGQEHKFDFEAIQEQCCLYDHRHIKKGARISSSVEATGLMQAAERIKQEKAQERLKAKAEAAKVKQEEEAFKTDEEKYKELFDPSMTVSYYDSSNKAITETVKVESLMRFVRIADKEKELVPPIEMEIDMENFDQMIYEIYGPDGVFY
jgi:hypothetical protein